MARVDSRSYKEVGNQEYIFFLPSIVHLLEVTISRWLILFMTLKIFIISEKNTFTLLNNCNLYRIQKEEYLQF